MMKKKLLITLIASVLLASCNVPTVTYKITVNESEHFYPINASLTFEKGHFNPIELKYTTDSNYAVYSVSALPEGSAVCTVENDGKVMIAPQQNVDFTITAETRLKDDFAHITFNQDEHFHPFESDITLNWGALQNIKVGYTIDTECRIKGVEVIPSDAANVTFDNKYIYISPQRNIDFSINVVTSDSFKMINFDPGEGDLDPEASSSAKFYYGEMWSDSFDKEIQKAHYEQYDFAGWSFTPGGFGEPIPFDYVIDDNTPSTVYASYIHHVDIDSRSLDVDDVYYSGNMLLVSLELIDSQRYSYPPDFHKEYFKVTNSNGEDLSFDYLHTRHEISINRNQAVDGLINIKVTDFQPVYDVDFFLSSHLEVIHHWEKVHAERGNTFTFDVQVKTDTNDIYYYIPYEINIMVGTSASPLSSKAYKIEPYDEYRQKAKVSISGEYVTNDLKIGINEIQTGYYYYELNGYGVKSIEGQTGSSTTEPIVLNIEGVEGYEDISKITSENILVKYYDDNYLGRWATYKSFNEIFSEGITLDIGNAHLTIGTSCLTECSSLSIYVFNPDYSIFANAAWSEIDEFTSLGLATYFFKIGEERENVSFGTQNYTLRIIDFNHDQLDGENDKYASLTIELEELISDDNGNPIKDYYEKDKQDNREFDGSDYDNYINHNLFDSMDPNLTPLVKTVKKKVRHGTVDFKTCGRKMFPLSITEFGYYPKKQTTEGSVYQYYKDADKSARIKYSTNGTQCEHYWTRSIIFTRDSYNNVPNSIDSVYTIEKDGGYDETTYYYSKDKWAYTAAFCI